MELHEAYNRIAEAWHQEIQERNEQRPGLAWLISQLSPGSTVLDVGCGSGLAAKAYLQAGMQVTGIDISEKLIEIARRENPNGHFLEKDLRYVREVPGVFDAVSAVAVLLHRPRAELTEALLAFKEKLKPGGWLFVVVKDKREDRPEEGVLTDVYGGETIERFFSFYTIDEVIAAFKSVGLEVVFSNVVPSGRARWIEVVGRKVSDA